MLAVVSALTMTVGNLAALPQQNVKRLLAYSSISHGGFLLMGGVLLTSEGLQAILIYLIIYLFMNLGAFFVVILIANEVGSETIDGYRGIGVPCTAHCSVNGDLPLFLDRPASPCRLCRKWILFAAVIKEKTLLAGNYRLAQQRCGTLLLCANRQSDVP